jgi:hypothetical protein
LAATFTIPDYQNIRRSKVVDDLTDGNDHTSKSAGSLPIGIHVRATDVIPDESIVAVNQD